MSQREDLNWTTAVLDDRRGPATPLLLIDFVPTGYEPTVSRTIIDAIEQTLRERGWRHLGEGIQELDDELVIGGDHMEADWVGSGDPDTYEGLSGEAMTRWLRCARDTGTVFVAIGPGLIDRSEAAGHAVLGPPALVGLARVRFAADR